jgi:sigma-B regulation protein RsbU (phosphoserine phosphatase)
MTAVIDVHPWESDMAILRFQDSADAQSVFAIPAEGLLMGRGGTCHLRFQSAAVSRQHARIIARDAQFVLEDLESRNGTYLNGRRVARPQLLHAGDRITICGVRLVFHDEPPSAELSGSWGSKPAAIWVVEWSGSGTGDSDFRRAVGLGEFVALPDPEQTQHLTVSDLFRRSADSAGIRGIKAEASAALEFVGQFLDRFRGCIRRTSVYSTLMEALLEVVPACDSCLLVRYDSEQTGVAALAATARKAGQDVAMCVSVMRTAAEQNELVLQADLWRADVSESEPGKQDSKSLRHILCLPLSDHGSVFAVLQLVSGQQERQLEEADAERLLLLSSAISFLVCNAEEAERHFLLEDRVARRPLTPATVLSASLSRSQHSMGPEGHP